jgi:hypothetical protein
MKTCPKCKKKTLRTREEEMKRVMANVDSIGAYMGSGAWKTEDAWSLCSEICTNKKCGHIK